jgi:hypothetical protein
MTIGATRIRSSNSLDPHIFQQKLPGPFPLYLESSAKKTKQRVLTLCLALQSGTLYHQ